MFSLMDEYLDWNVLFYGSGFTVVSGWGSVATFIRGFGFVGFTVVGTAFVIGALFTLFTGSLTFCSSLGRGTTFFVFIFLTGYFACLVSRGTSLLSTTVIITDFFVGTASK